MISILVKYKTNFLLRKCPSQRITAKRPLHSDYKKPPTTQTCDCSCLKDLFRVQWDFCDCYLQRALQGCSFPELGFCKAKSSCKEQWATSQPQAAAQILSTPPNLLLSCSPLLCPLPCVCEKSRLLAQDKQKETSSWRGQTQHKSSWEQRAILMRNTDENIPAFCRILGISRLSVRGLHSSAVLHSMRISRAPQRWRIFLWHIFHTETDAVLRHLPALVLTDNNRIRVFFCAQ